jgi:uncharacterized repeat protein (TIGR01451 family)
MRISHKLPLSFALALLGVLGIGAAPALASEGGPQWTVTAVSAPTNFAPGDESGDDAYRVTLTNTGGSSSDGTPVTIADTLPEGLTLDRQGATGFELKGGAGVGGVPGYGEEGTHLSCEGLTCTFSGVVIPQETLFVTIPVDVAAGEAETVTNVVRVSGGGAPEASVSTPTAISSTKAGFGIAPGSTASAVSSPQAGAYADLTTIIGFDTLNRAGEVAGQVKETVVDLPPGFAGDLVDTPTCPVNVFQAQACPIGTQVGIVTLTESAGLGSTTTYFVEPVYNLAPEPGDVAKLGFMPAGFGIQGDVTVNPDGYGLQTRFQNIVASTLAEFDRVSLTVWGVPSAAVHDPWRWNRGAEGKYGESSTNALVPYLSAPTSCTTEPLHAAISAYSWQAPEGSPSQALTTFGPLGGCDRLRLPSTLTAEVTSDKAYSATGLDVDTNVAQTYDNAEGLATSTLKKEVVTLPEGMTLNPSAGAGLGACTEAEYAEEGVQYIAGHGCPPESRLATVRIKTPSLSEEATGSLFLAEPAPFGEAHKNPFGSLLALYLIARIPNRGVLIKSPGLVEPNLVTGRLTTTFDNLPPLPFSLATFSFNAGANAPLVTPPACGNYTVQAALTPLSDPEGTPIEPLIPPFTISSGVGGGACPAGGVPPFNPGIVAGTENPNAGAYSPLNITITRNDGEQEITGFSSQLPPGLTANLTGVPFCSEAQIALARSKTGVQEEAEPSCPAASEIGHSFADAGVGPVLAQAPGKLYMAGPFEGAPFSVVSITSAHVGPFDLGTVVVHLPLFINPETAAVSIPAGAADQIPHIIKGILIHVREIRVYIDKANFALNPTNCDQQTFAATVIGGGADPTNPADEDPVTVNAPFRVTACQALKFAPKFAVSTSGKTSKSDGASLTAKLTYPTGALGSDANIKEVKVDLPKQLPSRLTTLQKACTAAQFNTNPAGCPAASLIGHATAITPILPVSLVGPAYFVSHGGEAFPDLEIVLQGYGVTIVLTGNTFISKAGITSSTFKTVPDQPVTSFELTLPEGPYSALAANGNLCGQKLEMPTEFVAQNGAEIHETTPIGVTGCAKVKALTRAQKLKKALKACRSRDHKRAKREKCEKAAREKYPVAKSKKKDRR